MENTLRVLSDKVSVLEEQKVDLQEAVTVLEESSLLPFESNEKAVVISEEINAPEVAETDDPHDSYNEFINEEMMAFMPFKK